MHVCECVCVLLFASGLDLLPFLVTFVVSFWEVQYGIVGGVVVSGFMLLYTVARPKVKVSFNCLLFMKCICCV